MIKVDQQQVDFEVTQTLMTAGGECNNDPESQLVASGPHRSTKWRMLLVLSGLAVVITLAIFSMGGSSLITFNKDGVTMLMEKEVAFDVVIRDFNKSHPDFERTDHGWHPNLVESNLGHDRKPVYKGGMTINSKESFDQWYRDTPGVNVRIDQKLKLKRNQVGHYVFDKTGFFPIDHQGFKDITYRHNYFFTLEMHLLFEYRGDEHFTFRGDDDLWVFINGKLVIDLGGTHEALAKTVQLSTLSLTPGEQYPLDLFFAERHTVNSNFRIETTISLEKAISIPEGFDPSQCCLIHAIDFMCFEEKHFWTFWC